MSNINVALRSEISRVARKELRGELDPLRKTLAGYRTTIAALKRQVVALERSLRKGSKARPAAERSEETGPVDSETGVQRRFSAQRLAAHRAKLGLSAAAYARLAGVSALSIYKWESGKVRPQASQIEALAAVRDLSRADIEDRLSKA